MQLIKEEITEEFIEKMVDRVIARLGEKFEMLDISLDYIGAILGDHDPASVGVQQRSVSRLARGTLKRPPGAE
tara:strand:- start:3028 stop:3246 length:219 start_codon:yes stop_codon:yes gene_type:complete